MTTSSYIIGKLISTPLSTCHFFKKSVSLDDWATNHNFEIAGLTFSQQLTINFRNVEMVSTLSYKWYLLHYWLATTHNQRLGTCWQQFTVTPSRQWMTQRQCICEVSYWHNTQLICVKHIKNSWMTISSVKISYPAECNCHLLYRMTSESYLMSSLPLLHLYISQCKFHMFISFQDHHPLVQHVLLHTTGSSTYEINY